MPNEWARDGFVVSTDSARIDLDMVHGFLTTSYWAEGIPREVVRRSIEHALYREAGWSSLAAPDRYMERWFKDVYRPKNG